MVAVRWEDFDENPVGYGNSPSRSSTKIANTQVQHLAKATAHDHCCSAAACRVLTPHRRTPLDDRCSIPTNKEYVVTFLTTIPALRSANVPA